MSKRSIDTYKQVNVSQEVSPYRAVQLLLDGALQRLMLARQAQQDGDVAVRVPDRPPLRCAVRRG